MTQEEKAKAYDEALERAKKYHTPESNNTNLMAVLEHIFPELAESEDERIRKQLIDAIKIGRSNSGISFTEEAASRYIAWIEKHSKEEIQKIRKEEYTNGFNDAAGFEKQKEQNVVPSRETILGIWELGNLWKENPEERDGLTQLQYIQKYWFEKNDYQKEQKVDIDKLRKDIYQSGYNDGYQHGKEDALRILLK